jgi:hypothetical protein
MDINVPHRLVIIKQYSESLQGSGVEVKAVVRLGNHAPFGGVGWTCSSSVLTWRRR